MLFTSADKILHSFSPTWYWAVTRFIYLQKFSKYSILLFVSVCKFLHFLKIANQINAKTYNVTSILFLKEFDFSEECVLVVYHVFFLIHFKNSGTFYLTNAHFSTSTFLLSFMFLTCSFTEITQCRCLFSKYCEVFKTEIGHYLRFWFLKITCRYYAKIGVVAYKLLPNQYHCHWKHFQNKY